MNALVSTSDNRILPMQNSEIETVRALETALYNAPQIDIPTEHLIHAGMYTRTIRIPAGTIVVGALIKIVTVLILQGDVIVYKDSGAVELHGYNVIAGSANRKQAVLAISDVIATMIFPTKAKTIEDAEKEFTDEVQLLLSNRQNNSLISITGE